MKLWLWKVESGGGAGSGGSGRCSLPFWGCERYFGMGKKGKREDVQTYSELDLETRFYLAIGRAHDLSLISASH